MTNFLENWLFCADLPQKQGFEILPCELICLKTTYVSSQLSIDPKIYFTLKAVLALFCLYFLFKHQISNFGNQTLKRATDGASFCQI